MEGKRRNRYGLLFAVLPSKMVARHNQSFWGDWDPIAGNGFCENYHQRVKVLLRPEKMLPPW
jgi:hypothetical protein